MVQRIPRAAADAINICQAALPVHISLVVNLPGLFLFFLMVVPAVGQVAVPAEEAAGADAYKPRAIQTSAHSLQGKLIKLQFICRSSVTEKTPNGGVTGEVVDSPTTRIKVNVEVPKEAVAWFMSIPTNYSGGGDFLIYARLSTDKFGEPIAKLLGRKLRSDAKGSRLEW